MVERWGHSEGTAPVAERWGHSEGTVPMANVWGDGRAREWMVPWDNLLWGALPALFLPPKLSSHGALQ